MEGDRWGLERSTGEGSWGSASGQLPGDLLEPVCPTEGRGSQGSDAPIRI